MSSLRRASVGRVCKRVLLTDDNFMLSYD